LPVGWLVVSLVCLLAVAPILWRLSAFGYHRWTAEDSALVPARKVEAP
jgi:hypothetical protein